MLSFLAGAVSGDLKENIRRLYEYSFKEFGIDLQPVIRFAFSNFYLKQTQISNVQQFDKNINKIREKERNAIQKIFNQNDKALNLTFDLLRKELGITNSVLLPSQTPLIPIAKYFYCKKFNSLDELDENDVKRRVC